jgi:proline iminopeptidase
LIESLETRDGRRLAYRREGDGPLVVCHPGGPGLSGAEFADFAGLRDSFELLLLDPRGTGGSDRPDDRRSYSFDDYVADLEELRSHLESERFALLGFSHGGIVAMAYAAAHPDRVDALLLVGTLAHAGPELEAEMQRALAEREHEPWFADARAALDDEQAAAFGDDDALRENLARQWPLYFGSYGEREREYVDAISEVTPNADALRFFNEVVWPSFDLRPALERIEAPTLVVAGERDFIAGPGAGETIATSIAGADLVVIPGAGHFPFVEAPDAFRAAVVEFMSAVVA